MKKVLKDILIGALGLLMMVLLILPSPLLDIIPYIAALDEVTEGLILINCFKYFGLDLTQFFKR